MTTLIKVFIICISMYAVLSQNSPSHELQSSIQFTNPRYLERLLKCVLGEGACDPQGRRLKSLAPTILRGQCIQCTPDEIDNIRKSLAYIQKNYPAAWAKIVRTYRY